jgi:manganese transport protein
MGEVAFGFIPTTGILRDPNMLYIAIGILGATVMPHNLYLHSSIVQTRKYVDTYASKAEAIRFATLDSSAALMFALFINAAILIMAAATFHGTGYESVAEIGDAYQLLSPLLGTGAASVLFAVALLCSGQERHADRHAGRPDRDGRVHQPPRQTVAAAAHYPHAGDHSSGDRRRVGQGNKARRALLILSQVILSLQLSFAVFPLVLFTCDRNKMVPSSRPCG